jgi:DNA modification methylase
LNWQKVNIKEVKLNPDNPRVIKNDKYKKLVESVRDFPEMLNIRPIVVNADMVVLGGNMRLKACKDAGMKEIPIVKADDLTPEQQKEFIIKDNLPYGEWDIEALKDWDAELLDDWGLEIEGFEFEQSEAYEDNYEEPEEIETDIVLGDLFQIGEHRLLCGDSTDSDQVARLMNGEKADMVFTDPPYGMGLDTDWSDAKSDLQFYKEKGCRGQGNRYDKVAGDNADFKRELIDTVFNLFNYCGEIFLWGADYYSELIIERNKGSWLVWDKRSNEGTNEEKVQQSDKMYGSCFELCWSKARHKRDIVRIKWAGIFGTKTEPDKDKSRKHPTQKPVKLAEYFINKFTKNGNLVVDIYAGVGFTMVACHQLNRKCYGMEIDPKYCQVIIDRMKALDPDIEVKKLS